MPSSYKFLCIATDKEQAHGRDFDIADVQEYVWKKVLPLTSQIAFKYHFIKESTFLQNWSDPFPTSCKMLIIFIGIASGAQLQFNLTAI